MNEPVMVPEASDEVKMSRRRLLKMVMAAGGSAAASSVLPDEWAKPQVQVGVLPAQSMVSPLFTIGSLNVACLSGAPPSAFYGADLYYTDTEGGVDDTATLYARTTPCGVIIFDGSKSLGGIGAVINGTNSSGTILFNFNSSACFNSNGTPGFCTILGVNRPFPRNSNEECQPFPKCPR